MDLLIKTSDRSEINRWNDPPGKVNIPGKGDVVFPAPDDRPLAIGPDHFLATATVVDEDIGDDQKDRLSEYRVLSCIGVSSPVM